MDDNQLKACVVTFPMKSGVAYLIVSDFLQIIKPLCKKLYVVGGNFAVSTTENRNITFVDVNASLHEQGSVTPQWWSNVLQLCKIFEIEIKLCIAVAHVAGDIDIVFFHLCGAYALPPLLVAKVLGKKVVTSALGRGSLSAKLGYRSFMRKFFLAHTLGLLESAVYALSDQIAVESPSAISNLNLDRYRAKTAIRGMICIDTSSFREITKIEDRALTIGYIGRLDPGKGSSNLIKAVHDLTKYRNDLKVIIAGEGCLFNTLDTEIEKSGLRSHVDLKRWIPHESMPHYLNQLRLFILASESEGLPRIVLEAMACGTVVVATPVGGIPDVIADGHTGFILEDSSQESIARTVMRAIQHPNLSKIAQNAHMEIENTYSFRSLVEQHRKTLARFTHA